MPNTAQINQPLSSHPLPFFLKEVLGGGANIVVGMNVGTDYLLIPPPPASANGVVARDVSSACNLMLFNNGVGAQDIPASIAPVLNFEVFLRNAGGGEVVLSVVGADFGMPPDTILPLIFAHPFLLHPTDQGVFLRLTPADPLTAINLSAHIQYLDLRDVSRVSLNLTTVPQTLLEGLKGKHRMLSRGGQESEEFYAVVANFDAINHDVVVTLTNGVDTILLSDPTNNTVVQGTFASLPVRFPPSLLEGWSISASMTVAQDDAPCTVLLAYTDTNLSPVRTNQGGGF